MIRYLSIFFFLFLDLLNLFLTDRTVSQSNLFFRKKNQPLNLAKRKRSIFRQR